MKVFEKEITLANKAHPMRVIPIGDIHIGAANVNKAKLNEIIEWIKRTENTYVIGMGDYCDCIDIKDKRFDIKAVDKRFYKDLDDIAGAQMDYIINLFAPIQDKILVMIPGNHEDKLRTRYSVDIMKYLKDGLAVDVGDYMTYLRLSFNRKQFHTSPITLWLQHGWFAGRKMGGKVNQLSDVASSYDADVHIAGHSHDLFATTSEKVMLPPGRMIPIKQKKIFINSGTFLETVSLEGTSYGEQKAYSVAKIGVACLDISPNHRPRPDMHVRL